jgi:hypothetical protein
MRILAYVFGAFFILCGIGCVIHNLESLFTIPRQLLTEEDIAFIAAGLVAGVAVASIGLLPFQRWSTRSNA